MFASNTNVPQPNGTIADRSSHHRPSRHRFASSATLAGVFGLAMVMPMVASPAMAQTETTTTVAAATTSTVAAASASTTVAGATETTLDPTQTTVAAVTDTAAAEETIAADEPVGGVDAGFGGAADGSGPGLTGPALAAAGVTGGIGAMMLRRRSLRRSIR